MTSQYIARSKEDELHIFRFLRGCEEQAVALDDLVDDLLGADRHDGDRIEFELRLHHVVLPSLAEAGVVEYDPRSRTIRYSGPDRTDRTSSSVFDWKAVN